MWFPPARYQLTDRCVSVVQVHWMDVARLVSSDRKFFWVDHCLKYFISSGKIPGAAVLRSVS